MTPREQAERKANERFPVHGPNGLTMVDQLKREEFIAAYLAGHSAARDEAEALVRSAQSVVTLIEVNQAMYSPTAHALLELSVHHLSEALKAWREGR